MDISVEIKAIKYKPLLCKKLNEVPLSEIGDAFSKYGSFILNVDDTNKFAISWWVSAKRTRSYPYARIYDTLNFSGKKVTIIPIFKDEGKEGDRDYLQWDTISLMSLLGVYIIISYYKSAEKSKRYIGKITNQRFDISQIENEIRKLLNFQSDALHWNLEQIETIGKIGQKALESYKNISETLGVEMHSEVFAEKRIDELLKGKESFMNFSRELAHKAQMRERVTIQPKEQISGEKSILTIKNYLGGFYYFTADEARIEGNNILLIECKHSRNSMLPSLDDIKDGLIKMALFTNLTNVVIDGKKYFPEPILKLTSKIGFNIDKLKKPKKEIVEILKEESEANEFKVEYL